MFYKIKIYLFKKIITQIFKIIKNKIIYIKFIFKIFFFYFL